MDICLAFGPIFFKLRFCYLCSLLLARPLSLQLLHLAFECLQPVCCTLKLILHRWASCWLVEFCSDEQDSQA